MAHRQEDFKRGITRETGTDKRSQNQRDGIRKQRRDKLLQKRRRRGDGTVAMSVERYIDMVKEFQSDAVLQTQDRQACLHHLQLLDNIQRFQCDYMLEDLLSDHNGYGGYEALKFMRSLDPLIDRLIELVINEPLARVLALNVLCNMTHQRAEKERWIYHMICQTPLLKWLSELVVKSPQTAMGDDTEAWAGLIVLLGNFCDEAPEYRDACLACDGLLDSLLLVAAVHFRDAAFDSLLCWFIAMLYKHLPLPSASVLEKIWPFISNVLGDSVPDEQDAVQMVALCSVLQTLSDMARLCDHHRNFLCTNAELVQRLVQYATHDSTPSEVRISACMVLTWLPVDLCHHAALVQARVPETFLHCLTHKSTEVRHAAAQGLVRLSLNPKLSNGILSTPDARRVLIHTTLHGNHLTRKGTLTVLSVIGRAIHRNAGLVLNWLNDGLIVALTACFDLVGEEAIVLECLRALSVLFAHPTHGGHARVSFEDIEGDDRLAMLRYTAAEQPLVAEEAETLLKAYWDTDCQEANLTMDLSQSGGAAFSF